jgi:hypothetical protein
MNNSRDTYLIFSFVDVSGVETLHNKFDDVSGVETLHHKFDDVSEVETLRHKLDANACLKMKEGRLVLWGVQLTNVVRIVVRIEATKELIMGTMS